MFKIELTATQLVWMFNLLEDAVDRYTDMQNEAREQGEYVPAFAYSVMVETHKKCIASIEAQMKEQSK